MQEAILNSIIEGPTDEIWPRLLTELPSLVVDARFSKMVLKEITEDRNLRNKLILCGLLPGINELSLDYKLENYYSVPPNFRDAIDNSI